ncbi:DUF3649 domain-containing protein [uncultured Massilia sp.]|uniref:DUF3649 domain-containing protein n=1 Tax=uncultured Massilia sp. TaxID=169973 RepID=UPI0025E047A4|nr:DUF3649 domain-containing protein [uncultured Massilia sp.]
MRSLSPGGAPAARPLPASGPTPGYRAAVASRAGAAIGGGYLLSWLAVRALALGLPMDPVDNVVAATLVGLAVYPCAVMWVFAAATPTRAWLGLGGACALFQLAILVLRALGGQA